uniref:4-hydroxy-4-methyl-2-oxoglutarate aldolase n=1 Tax=Ditylum brightwellii TaxID=49249 RepID=A0A7S4QU66_9STRA
MENYVRTPEAIDWGKLGARNVTSTLNDKDEDDHEEEDDDDDTSTATNESNIRNTTWGSTVIHNSMASSTKRSAFDGTASSSHQQPGIASMSMIKTESYDERPQKRKRAPQTEKTAEEKLVILKELEGPENPSIASIAKKYGVNRKTIHRWKKSKDKFVELVEERSMGKYKRVYNDPLAKVKDAVDSFYKRTLLMPPDQRLPVTGSIIAATAMQAVEDLLAKHAKEPFLAQEEVEEMTKFKGSESWGRATAQRMRMRSAALHGEAVGSNDNIGNVTVSNVVARPNLEQSSSNFFLPSNNSIRNNDNNNGNNDDNSKTHSRSNNSSVIESDSIAATATALPHRQIIATADLCDDFITSPDRLSVVNPSPRFYNYGRITSFFGKIYTIRCFESNPLVRKTLSQPGNGQVLVVDGGASQRVAILGDELAKLAHDNNWAGVIINGCIRDSKAIGMMDVGVKALGTHPLKSIKNHEGEGGVIVSFSGVEFVHGHWLYSDEVRYIQTLCIFL